MSDLFDRLAEKLKEELDSDETPAQVYNVVRQFLKDNGITASPEFNAKIGGLVDSAINNNILDMPKFEPPKVENE